MIFTIGFTQKSAEVFFDLLTQNKVDLLIDIRLNNTSQLAGFAKFPDIQFFLKNILISIYFHRKDRRKVRFFPYFRPLTQQQNTDKMHKRKNF